MKIDRFTKATLAIIAVCLLWICVRDVRFIEAANPQESFSDMMIRMTQAENGVLGQNTCVNIAAVYDVAAKKVRVYRASPNGKVEAFGPAATAFSPTDSWQQMR